MSQMQGLGGLGNVAEAWPAVAMAQYFVVQIDNTTYDLGSWSRATGLSVTWDKLEHREGNLGNYVLYLPGKTTYEPITLSRAAGAQSATVQRWLAQTSRNPQPLSGTIQLISPADGTPVVEWRLTEFFPIGWQIESFDPAASKPAVETLKIAHTGFLSDDLSMANSMAPGQ
jgi:phage tail-like protein